MKLSEPAIQTVSLHQQFDLVVVFFDSVHLLDFSFNLI